MNPCKKVHEVPSVVTDWQQTTWCPDCEHYERGTCGNPTRTNVNAPCPFHGKELPLREAAVDAGNEHPQKPLDAALCAEPESQPRPATLGQEIWSHIVQRTGGRIQALEVEVKDRGVVIRGTAPCYYVKQLALQGVIDVIGFARAIRAELNVPVPESPGTSWPDAQ